MLKLEATKNFISFYVVKDILEEAKLVYCSKCDKLNPDKATKCSNCWAPLYAVGVENKRYSRREYRHHNHEEEHVHHGRRHAGFGLLIRGVIIILIALSLLFLNFSLFFLYLWPVILVLVGVSLIARAVILNRRYRQPTPNSLLTY